MYYLSGYLKKCTELVPGDPTSQRQIITTHVYPPRNIQDIFLEMCGVMVQLKGMGYKQFPGFDECEAMQLGSPNQECWPTGDGTRPDSRVVSEHTSEDGTLELGSRRSQGPEGLSETIVRRVEEHAVSLRPDWDVPHPDDTVLFESTDGDNVDVTADQGVETQDQDSAES